MEGRDGGVGGDVPQVDQATLRKAVVTLVTVLTMRETAAEAEAG